MEEEDERETVAETGMLGLVMPDFHAEKSTDTAAQEGNGEETGVRDTPFIVAGFPFINAVEEEGNDVERVVLDDYADPDSKRYENMLEIMRKQMHFTSLRFNRIDDMVEATGLPADCLCTYCWTGKE